MTPLGLKLLGGVFLLSALTGGITFIVQALKPHSQSSVSATTSPTPATTSYAAPVETPQSDKLARAAETPSPLPSPSPPPVATAPAVIGFGATSSHWNAHHTEDKNFDPGTVYDRDSAMRQINGHAGDRYTGVARTDDRITNYQRNLPDGTSADAAKAALLQDFPADATIVWYVVKDSCADMEVKSATLGNEFASDPHIGDKEGMVFINMYAEQTDGSTVWDPRNVNASQFLLLTYKSASDAPAC